MANTNITPSAGSLAASGQTGYRSLGYPTTSGGPGSLASAPMRMGNDLLNWVQGATPTASQPFAPWVRHVLRFTDERQAYAMEAPLLNLGTGFLALPTPLPVGALPSGGRDDSIGSPTPPSHKIIGPVSRSHLWPVTAGSRSISVDCRQARDPGTSQRPRLVVVANPECLVWDDVVATMDGTIEEWITLTCNVTVGADGVLEVRREVRDLSPSCAVWWDNFRRT